ncbi:glycine-rich domain-containing protein, partial [Enterobacter kobei]
GISASATSLTVNSGTGSLFPAPSAGVSFFKLTLIDAATGQLTEIMHVTARTGDTMTIDRGQEGTTARAWSANDIAANMMTAGTLSYLLTNFQPLDSTLTALATLVGAANKLPYFNGVDSAALTDLTAVGRDIIGKGTAADILTYLGLGDTSGYVGRWVNTRVFTSSGTYTPTPGTKSIIVEVQGGGGGGGNAQATSSTTYTLTSSGGAGGYAKSRLTNLAASYSVTVGAGGAGGAGGGQSVFGSITCGGGAAGSQIGGSYTASSNAVSLGASGGSASGGNIVNAPGSSANPSFLIASVAVSAVGGSSAIGTGGKGAGSSSSTGFPGTLGGGGGGANAAGNTTLTAGGKGGDGVVIIWEYA